MSEKSLPINKRGLNFEMFMWIITRLTALAMYALLLTAAIGALIMGARTQMNLADVIRWSFMPNLSHVQNTNVPDLVPWASTFWQLVASAFLMIAVGHGVHGLVTIADDYIVSPRGRSTVRFFSIVMLLAMIAMGLYVIWTSGL
jgi:succinate dehydrogenase hydrophobic anchor subunit